MKTNMKTIQQTITRTIPKLVISNDEFTDSPREWSNLGYFITCDRNYYSPDRHEVLETIVKRTGQEATSQAEHIKLIKIAINSLGGDKVKAIYPICKYEHSGVVYKLGSFSGFDYSNNGFYIITDKTAKELGVKPKDYEKVIKDELEVYNKYANGEVYQYCLYDDNGEVVESCGGFYNIDDIKAELPDEWKDENLQEYYKA
jgi:hypothetical protein